MKKFNLLILLLIVAVFRLNAEYTSYDEAIKMLSKADTKAYPEADQVEVQNSKVTLDDHCLGTTISENYSKILTDKGKQEASYAYFYYDADYDTVIVNKIEIIKADGKVVPVDPAKILKPMNASAYSSFMNIFSETQWLLSGVIPKLEVGDIVHTLQTRITHKQPMDENFSDQISAESMSPVLHNYYELTAPSNRKFNIHHINKKDGLVNISESTAGSNKIYKFDVSNTPQIIYEPNMEQTEKFAYYVVITTVNKWEDISKWYYSLVAPHLIIDKTIKDTVATLIKDCKTKEEKIKSIFYWVAPSIRYLGVDREKGHPGFEPHDVSYTFSTRGGVCRDKSALLVSMLREAGIPSDPILIAAGYQLNPIAPVINFNHAVVVSYDDKGQPEYFFDPTAETTKDFFPQYEEDCSYIIASEKGADLKLVPVSNSSRNKTALDITLKVNDDLSATGTMKGTFSGLSDFYIRQGFMMANPQKIKEAVERIITSLHPLAEVTDFKVSDAKDKSKDMEFSASFKIPNYISKDGNLAYIPLEAGKFTLSPLYQYFMSPLQLSERKYPFKMMSTFSIDVNQDMKVPFQLDAMSLPKFPNLNFNGFNLTQTTNLLENNTRLINKATFSSDKIHFNQDEFLPLKSRLSIIEQLNSLYIIGNVTKSPIAE